MDCYLNKLNECLEIVKKNNHENLDHNLIEQCILNHFFMRNLENSIN